MASALGVLVLLVGLLLSIALHEIGHMVPAKRFGVRVSKYMVGFGPTLWSRTRGETEYGLKGIPLGGYVRLVGMFPPADVVGARRRPGRMGELVEAAREASAEEIPPGEEHRAFYRLSTPKKVVVMLGGPFMNLVIAAVLFGALLMGFGVPADTTTVGYVGQCVQAPDAPPEQECSPADPRTPAAQAGLRPGDRLLSYGGVPVTTWGAFLEAVRDTDEGTVPLVVVRDGQEVVLSVTPAMVERPVRDPLGNVVLDEDGTMVTAEQRYIGLSPTRERQPQSVGAVVDTLTTTVVETAKIVVALPVKLWQVTQVVLGQAERDATSVMGVVGIARVSGELASIEGLTLADHVANQMSVLAYLNVALFVFNLIPLLPLDGGHVVGALWEGGRRQLARLRGAPRPRPADVARMVPLAYGVFMVFALMGLLLLYADIVYPVRLT